MTLGRCEVSVLACEPIWFLSVERGRKVMQHSPCGGSTLVLGWNKSLHTNLVLKGTHLVQGMGELSINASGSDARVSNALGSDASGPNASGFTIKTKLLIRIHNHSNHPCTHPPTCQPIPTNWTNSLANHSPTNPPMASQ